MEWVEIGVERVCVCGVGGDRGREGVVCGGGEGELISSASFPVV